MSAALPRQNRCGGATRAQLAHLSKVDTYVIIKPVSAAVISRSVHTERLWQTPVLALCGLLFFFALHAKIAVYGGPPLKVTPSTASKLWANGQKMQGASVDSSPNALFWVASFCLCALCLNRVGRVQRVLITPYPADPTLRYRRRFLRPPPIQSFS